MQSLWSFGIVLLLAGFARAEVRTSQVEYRDGADVCEGYLAYDDATDATRPAVLVFPEWWGITEHPKKSAEKLAKLGYVALVVDMYGKGDSTDDPKQALQMATPFYKDRPMMRRRAQAAMDTLSSQKFVDKDHIAAIGYCFGGSCAIELARSGAPLVGVVGLHSGLSRDQSTGPDAIKGKVLICHGADDPMVKPEELAAFEREMKDAKVDYQINIYSGAVHAFTNPDADKHRMKGIAYNEQAAKRSWEAMKDFLGEVTGK